MRSVGTSIQNHLLEVLLASDKIDVFFLRTEHSWVWMGLVHTGQLQSGPSLMGASRHVFVLLRVLLRFKGPEPNVGMTNHYRRIKRGLH